MMKIKIRVRNLLFFFALIVAGNKSAMAQENPKSSTTPKSNPTLSNLEIKGTDISVRDADGVFLCKVSAGDDVRAIAEHEDGKRFKIQIKKKGCPEEGFLSTDSSKFLGDQNKLVIVTDGNGPKKDCVNCSVKTEPKRTDPILSVKEVTDKLPINKIIQPTTTTSVYISELREFIKNENKIPTSMPVSRGLVRIPVRGSTGTIGPCGSVHYNPNDAEGIDAYANPLTACVFANVLQEWNKKYCPVSSGCTIQFGDISHKDNPCWNRNMRRGRCPSGSDHYSHTNGYCIDVRPLTDSFNYGALTYNSPNYNRAKTKQLIEFFIANGADKEQLFFNDPQLIIESSTRVITNRRGKKVRITTKLVPRSDRSGVHNNHIHVCFKNNKITQNVCNNLTVDKDICPDFK